MEKILLSLVSAGLGFFFSQLFNAVGYLRRPKFQVSHFGNGVLSSYTGSGDDEEPWQIELGFFVDNTGKNPAKNVRIFVSELHTWDVETGTFDEAVFSFSELRRPIDVLPSGETIRVLFGSIQGNNCSLEIPFENQRDRDQNEYLDSDTRFKKKFKATFHIFCDDKNSSWKRILEFDPSDGDEWSQGLLEEYDSLDFRKSIVMPLSAH